MSNVMQKVGKMIRDAGSVDPTAKPEYRKEASPHTFVEPEVAFNAHIKEASSQEGTDELENLMLAEAVSMRETPPEDKAAVLNKVAAKSAMDNFDSQKVIEAVNSAKTVDEKIKAYLSSSNAEALQTPKEKGE